MARRFVDEDVHCHHEVQRFKCAIEVAGHWVWTAPVCRTRSPCREFGPSPGVRISSAIAALGSSPPNEGRQETRDFVFAY